MFYGTLAGALTYHTEMGHPAWAVATEAAQRGALIRASRALDGKFGAMFGGVKATSEQRLAWPRREAFDYCAQLPVADGVTPPAVIEAAYEIALVELARPGAMTPTVTPGRITKSEAVSGAASRSFFSPEELGIAGGLNAFRPTLLAAEDLLSCYLNTGSRWAAVVV